MILFGLTHFMNPGYCFANFVEIFKIQNTLFTFSSIKDPDQRPANRSDPDQAVPVLVS